VTVRIAPESVLGDDWGSRARAGETMRHLFRLSVPFITILSVACGGSEGQEGKVTFTPLDCGRTSCSFDDPLAAGGRVALHVVGEEGVSTIGLDVRSSDGSKMTVEGIPDVGGRPTWELSALGAGELDLEVFRPGEGEVEDEVIDRLTINISAVARLGLQNFIGSAVGPGAAGAGFDETWSINADSPVSFRVTPFDSGDVAAMGLFDYTVTLDTELEQGLIDRNTSEGRLYLSSPAGTWMAEWVGGGTTFTAQIIAE